MPYSRITYEYSGQSTFSINFTLGYLSRDHVTCRVNEEEDGGGSPLYRTITWINDGVVEISGSLNTGDSIVFERNTPKNILINDYSDGSVLDDDNLDASYLQALMIAHEALDGRLGVVGADIDMGNNYITNLAAGVADTDAANVKQLNDTISAVQSNLNAAQAAQTAAEVAQAAAEDAESGAEASEQYVEDWASKTDGLVEGTDYSSKAYAIGGTGVTGILGSSKDWATYTIDTVDGADYSAKYYALQAATSASMLPKNNYTATANPTINDDFTEGYSAGSKWIFGGKQYVCVDASEGAADWEDTSLTLDDLGSIVVQDSDNLTVGLLTTTESVLTSTTDSSTNAVLHTWESEAGRTLELKQPNGADNTSPFIFETGNALQFNVDGNRVMEVNALGNVDITGTLNANLTDARKVDVRSIPQNTQNDDYTFVLADGGNHVITGDGGDYTWTIPPASSVDFPIGTAITLVIGNSSGGSITIARGSGVFLRSRGNGTSENKTLDGPASMATILKVGPNYWLISGES